MTNEEEEPLSPMARLFQSPEIEYCEVITIGFKTKINPDVVLHALKLNVSKHPRFSSKLSDNGAKWIETEVNVEDHVTVPYIDPKEIGGDGQSFVDDYISRLTMIPLDRSKPLWDIHILNVKTADAEAVGFIRSHHSLGDFTSLISLMLACTHKTSDPEMLPIAIPSMKRRGTASHSLENKGWFLRSIFTIGSKLRLIWNTVVDVLLLLATIMFLKDTETPLKGGENVLRNPKRFYHKSVSFDDIKLIKNAMSMTINDVLIGITQASLSRYLNRQHVLYKQDKKNEDGELISYPNNLPDGIRFRAAYMMVKDSKCRWGNYFSFIILPLSVNLQADSLVYLTTSKSMMARKKHSYHALLVYFMVKIVPKVFGAKAGAAIFNRPVMNTTTCVSNVMGPTEEISFLGHPIAYITPSCYGHPHALLVHYMSYADKMIFSIMVDPTIIPDPHKICDDMEESLKAMKDVLSEKGFL